MLTKNSLLVTVTLFLISFQVQAVTESSGYITMEFDFSHHSAVEEVQLWIPYPFSDRDQLISHVEIEGDYIESAVYSDQVYSTPILYARWPAGTSSRKLNLSFHVDRQEVVHRDFPAQEASWNPQDFAASLKPTRSGPIDGAVKVLADQITLGESTVAGKAKAIYDWICENMYRDPETSGCGSGDVSSLLINPGGKCTDIHSVFVSLCRAAGVPAREIFGIRQGKEAEVDITRWQHCWAEFYLPGYGWVPVDPADVLKMMLKEDLKLTDARTRYYRDYFWGAWDPYRVKLAMGRDLRLTPPQSGALLNTFGYPYAQVGDVALDWLNPADFKYSFTFRR